MDTVTPNVARIYDYFLGGKDNFAADRAAAEEIIKSFPDTPVAARANRDFMRRAVRHLSADGITQFLDVGSGLPTRGNVHEQAPGARVTYVDYDPVVVRHAQALLGGAPDVSIVAGDLRRPRDILAHAEMNLDLTRPVALLLIAVLHFVPDEDGPYDIVATFLDALPSGSHLVISHLTNEGVPEERLRAGRAAYQNATAPIVPRSRADIARFFAGLRLLDPGLTWLSEWRPDDPNTPHSHGLAAVARKP